jgi:hypothetical protein
MLSKARKCWAGRRILSIDRVTSGEAVSSARRERRVERACEGLTR